MRYLYTLEKSFSRCGPLYPPDSPGPSTSGTPFSHARSPGAPAPYLALDFNLLKVSLRSFAACNPEA